MLASLLTGVLLGLGAAVPIGPVNVELARRTLLGGFRAGFVLGCGAVTVDVTYAALTSFGIARVLDQAWLRTPLFVGGTGILLYLGISCVRAALLAPRSDDDGVARSQTGAGGYITGLLMTALNPMTLAFWLVAVPAAGARHSSSSLPLVCVGVFIGTIAWVTGFASVIASIRRFRRGWWMSAVDLVGGVILLGFATLSGLAALRSLGIIA